MPNVLIWPFKGCKTTEKARSFPLYLFHFISFIAHKLHGFRPFKGICLNDFVGLFGAAVMVAVAAVIDAAAAAVC